MSLTSKTDLFISLRAASGIVHNIAYAFSEKSRDLMRDTASSESVVPLRTPLMLLSSVIEARPETASSEDIRSFLPDFFVFGHVLPRAELLSSEAKALCAQARQIWSTGIESEGLGLESRDALLGSVRAVLRDLITDVNSRAAYVFPFPSFSCLSHFNIYHERIVDLRPYCKLLQKAS